MIDWAARCVLAQSFGGLSVLTLAVYFVASLRPRIFSDYRVDGAPCILPLFLATAFTVLCFVTWVLYPHPVSLLMIVYAAIFIWNQTWPSPLKETTVTLPTELMIDASEPRVTKELFRARRSALQDPAWHLQGRDFATNSLLSYYTGLPAHPALEVILWPTKDKSMLVLRETQEHNAAKYRQVYGFDYVQVLNRHEQIPIPEGLPLPTKRKPLTLELLFPHQKDEMQITQSMFAELKEAHSMVCNKEGNESKFRREHDVERFLNQRLFRWRPEEKFEVDWRDRERVDFRFSQDLPKQEFVMLHTRWRVQGVDVRFASSICLAPWSTPQTQIMALLHQAVKETLKCLTVQKKTSEINRACHLYLTRELIKLGIFEQPDCFSIHDLSQRLREHFYGDVLLFKVGATDQVVDQLGRGMVLVVRPLLRLTKQSLAAALPKVVVPEKFQVGCAATSFPVVLMADGWRPLDASLHT